MKAIGTKELSQSIEDFCNFIKKLPSNYLEEQDWGPTEVLAHLVFHHELYVKLVEADVFKLPLVPLEGKYREINARAVAANRGCSVDQLVERLGFANRRLVELYEAYDPTHIAVQIKAGVKVRSLAELVPEVEAHIRNHLDKLREEL
jgi:hypothetical protein